MKSNELIADSEPALSFEDHIQIQGARANNLKNIDLTLPKNIFIVVTGLSGSGKSSLVMDTLYAEGQRRYVESLSSYARQFLNRMKKPEVDFIRGLCPAIAIEQRTSGKNARSTVGSLTEINDYLRLLFARAGTMYSPVSGEPVKKHTVTDVVDYIHTLKEGTKIQLWIPLQKGHEKRTLYQELDLLMQKGYTRYRKKEETNFSFIQDSLDDHPKELNQTMDQIDPGSYLVLIDRFVVKGKSKENRQRIADSVHTAFLEGGGDCLIEVPGKSMVNFNNRLELDGMEFPELSPHLFNYNNPYGACERCQGYGRILGIAEEKVIPDPTLSIYEEAIACWSGPRGKKWLDRFLNFAHEIDFPVHRAYEDLSQEQKDLLWNGNQHFKGIWAYFDKLEEKSYKIQNRVILARFRGRTKCPECNGTRLRKETSYVRVGGVNIQELLFLPIDELHQFFKAIQLSEREMEIGSRILIEIRNRLGTMVKIGLGYLSLERLSSTLSGGETQRIHLTRTLSSNLTHSMYILDEPSIGLHPKDSDQLVKVLKELRDLGNTVIVVEHEEEIIRTADHILELGPDAGRFGGDLVYNGPYKSFAANAKNSYTADYLSGRRSIERPDHQRNTDRRIRLFNARKHNLQNLEVEIPLGAMTVVTGVSGSGKSTLVADILQPLLLQTVQGDFTYAVDQRVGIDGPVNDLDSVEVIDQNPIGRSSRSNPVTYIKAYDSIRSLYASRRLSKIRGYQSGHFSFNVDGGRCENCKGEGFTTVEMQFLADVKLECEECRGRRFKDEVLEVEYKGKNIYDVLKMSVEEAIEFFDERLDIADKLRPLDEVGLGYVKLGQASNTLSGGEAQRVKLASYLSKENTTEQMLYIFDEPTTGLHFHDIHKLLYAMNALIERGHTVIVVEHNMEVIKCADWIIDLGPGGGKEGGQLMYQGPLDGILKVKESHTATYLKPHLQG